MTPDLHDLEGSGVDVTRVKMHPGTKELIQLASVPTAQRCCAGLFGQSANVPVANIQFLMNSWECTDGKKNSAAGTCVTQHPQISCTVRVKPF